MVKLEESKIFIYLSCPTNRSLSCPTNKTDAVILLEAELYYDYLKKYKPISIIAKMDDVDVLDVDKYVKKYMICFGIDNVRGGSYIDEILPEFQRVALASEFETAMKNNECKNMDELYCMINNHTGVYTNIQQIEAKKRQLQTEYDTYVKEVNELSKWSIDPTIIEDIEWLRTIIQAQRTTITQEQIAKYKRLLPDLKKIYNLYENEIYTYDSLCNTEFLYSIKYPQLLLDDIFFHFNRIHLEKSVEAGQYLCHTYTYFANTIINKMQEAQFHVDSWNKEIEWTTPRAIYLLDKIAAYINSYSGNPVIDSTGNARGSIVDPPEVVLF